MDMHAQTHAVGHRPSLKRNIQDSPKERPGTAESEQLFGAGASGVMHSHRVCAAPYSYIGVLAFLAPGTPLRPLSLAATCHLAQALGHAMSGA